MSLTSKEVAAARGRLHASVCRGLSWSEDCQRPDGGRHARETWSSERIRALAADPAALHDSLCFAALQHHATQIEAYRCRRPVEHAAAMHAHFFGAPAAADEEPDLFAALEAS